jgi:hypothetical protein
VKSKGIKRTFNESIAFRSVLETFLKAICNLLALEFELLSLEGSNVTVDGQLVSQPISIEPELSGRCEA